MHSHTHHTSDDHGHDHGHGHGSGAAPRGRAFAIGTALNAGFIAVQVGYGLAAHSSALLADAVHNLGDVLGLLAAWGATHLAGLAPSRGRTYGWGRGTILAALSNAIILLLGCGIIVAEAIPRLIHPTPVAGATVIWVACLGIAINGATALLFMRGRAADLNVRGAFLHMAADAMVSAGVAVSGALVLWLGWHWLDPLTSLGIVVVITIGTWSLLRDSLDMAMDAVPEGIDLSGLETALQALPDVAEVHDLHVWALSTTQTALTAHLVRTPAGDPARLLRLACELSGDRFGISHATFQIETLDAAEGCALRPAGVV